MRMAKRRKKKSWKLLKAVLSNLRTFSSFLPMFTHLFARLSQKTAAEGRRSVRKLPPFGFVVSRNLDL